MLSGGPDDHRLSDSQRRALQTIKERASRNTADAHMRMTEVLIRAGVSADVLAAALQSLRDHARVALHFHPDRFTNTGKTVVEGLLTDGLYRSQFETGISNGSPTAFPGGERDLWERRLFDGAYHTLRGAAQERPKYGSVFVCRHADGPSPRFGSCYIVLKPSASQRCTFTYGDSHTHPEHVGTIDTLMPILAAALIDIETKGVALGLHGVTAEAFLNYLCTDFLSPHGDPAHGRLGRVLDDYIEAQVHGPIDLSEDVERLVADPSFRGTPTGEQLETMCNRYNIFLQWHPGFVLPASSVPSHFRGPTIPPLARRIAEVAGTELLDAAAIGVGAASAHRRPERWSEWGTYDDVLRRFRQMWHVLVQFGQPAATDVSPRQIVEEG